MSKKIPFLQMFAALRRWTELSNAVEGWLILSAAIDRASRSAKITVDGAAGAGSNLIQETEETLCRAYQLNSVKIEVNVPEPVLSSLETPQEGEAVAEEQTSRPTMDDAFARSQAIRQAAMKKISRPAPTKPKGAGGGDGKAIFGKAITKAPMSIGELELDMGTVVVEGDVFAVVVAMYLARMDVKSAYELFKAFLGQALGALAGVFILGAFTKKTSALGAFSAFIAATAVILYCNFNVPFISFWTYSLIAIVVTMVVGVVVSKIQALITGKTFIASEGSTCGSSRQAATSTEQYASTPAKQAVASSQN